MLAGGRMACLAEIALEDMGTAPWCVVLIGCLLPWLLLLPPEAVGGTTANFKVSQCLGEAAVRLDGPALADAGGIRRPGKTVAEARHAVVASAQGGPFAQAGQTSTLRLGTLPALGVRAMDSRAEEHRHIRYRHLIGHLLTGAVAGDDPCAS